MAIVKRTPRPGELTRGAKHSRFLVFDKDGRPVASDSKASDFAKWPSNPHEGDTIVYGPHGPTWTSDETPFNPNAEYPNLTAGKANEAAYLSSDREIDDSSGACPPSTFGPTGGTAEVASGYVALTEILGNTVVENGELKHSKSKYIKSVGRNILSAPFMKGYKWTTGVWTSTSDDNAATPAKMRVFPSTEYCIILPNMTTNVAVYAVQYDKNKDFLETISMYDVDKETTFTTNASAYYVTFFVYRSSPDFTDDELEDIHAYIYYNTPHLPFEPYWEDVIQLPDIEVKSTGGLTVVHDVLHQTGGGKQNVLEYVFTGSENWAFDSTNEYFQLDGIPNPGMSISMSGMTKNAKDLIISGPLYAGSNDVCSIRIYLSQNPGLSSSTDMNEIFTEGSSITYKAATPVDIVSDGWTAKLRVDNFGTLQFLDEDENEVAVAQAYNIYYTVNLVEYLDTAYAYTDGDPSKLMLKADNVIPDAPTTDGAYGLTVTVADGAATYTWESTT